jgi:hypothetical protein
MTVKHYDVQEPNHRTCGAGIYCWSTVFANILATIHVLIRGSKIFAIFRFETSSWPIEQIAHLSDQISFTSKVEMKRKINSRDRKSKKATIKSLAMEQMRVVTIKLTSNRKVHRRDRIGANRMMKVVEDLL